MNNAGRAPRVRADLLEASEQSFEDVLRTNLQGPYFLTQAIARDQIAPIRFTFFWPQADRWEGRDFVVNVERRSGCKSG